jgi:hypothetical protein
LPVVSIGAGGAETEVAVDDVASGKVGGRRNRSVSAGRIASAGVAVLAVRVSRSGAGRVVAGAVAEGPLGCSAGAVGRSAGRVTVPLMVKLDNSPGPIDPAPVGGAVAGVAVLSCAAKGVAASNAASANAFPTPNSRTKPTPSFTPRLLARLAPSFKRRVASARRPAPVPRRRPIPPAPTIGIHP